VTNVVADALSRRDTKDTTEVMALSIPSFILFDDLHSEMDADDALHIEVAAGGRGVTWSVVDGLVTVGGRVYVPATSPSLPAILDNAHGAGHKGTEKTLHHLRTDFHVPRARALVRDFVRACTVCQRNKSEHLNPAGLLQPLEVPSSIWSDIILDFIKGFLRVNGKTVILTVVDRFSKYAHFVPLGHSYFATTVAKAFFDNIVRLHGLPTSMVSDCDPVYTGHFRRELFKLSGTQLNFSAFHPQSDGQSEATDRIITMYLRCLSSDIPRQWLQWLPWVEYCYNTTYQSSLRTLPFRVVYGRGPPSMRQFVPGEAVLPAVQTQMTSRDEFLAEIKERLEQAQ
jgi:hypothetical protein